MNRYQDLLRGFLPALRNTQQKILRDTDFRFPDGTLIFWTGCRWTAGSRIGRVRFPLYLNS